MFDSINLYIFSISTNYRRGANLPPTSSDRGSISLTYLRTAFTSVALKSVRIQSSCKYLFTLLVSTGTKAAFRMLMKLTQKATSEKSRIPTPLLVKKSAARVGFTKI